MGGRQGGRTKGGGGCQGRRKKEGMEGREGERREGVWKAGKETRGQNRGKDRVVDLKAILDVMAPGDLRAEVEGWWERG